MVYEAHLTASNEDNKSSIIHYCGTMSVTIVNPTIVMIKRYYCENVKKKNEKALCCFAK